MSPHENSNPLANLSNAKNPTKATAAAKTSGADIWTAIVKAVVPPRTSTRREAENPNNAPDKSVTVIPETSAGIVLSGMTETSLLLIEVVNEERTRAHDATPRSNMQIRCETMLFTCG
jgi:hypothetical protein